MKLIIIAFLSGIIFAIGVTLAAQALGRRMADSERMLP